MSEPDTVDIVELCALLQCLGFGVKSLDTSDTNLSQEGPSARSIVINCQSSGINVVLECPAATCSCPPVDLQNSGFWQVSGVAGGKKSELESGSRILHALPKPYRARISQQLKDMIRYIRAMDDIENGSKIINKSASMVDLASKSAGGVDSINKSGSLADISKEANKSTSILEIATPEKRQGLIKAETPTRYRSLDTLTVSKDVDGQNQFGVQITDLKSLHRQETYTLSSTPGSISRIRNKTSSPIETPTNSILENLIDAEKATECLRNKISAIIREYVEDGKNDSSISSMLDVSKISILKASEMKTQFASSPNLSGAGLTSIREDYPKSKLKRFESASTSNINKPTPDNFKSKLKRLSPSMFKGKNNTSAANNEDQKKSKLQSLFKSKIVTPVRTASVNSAEPSPFLNSASKKKFSHVKSTIPRPTPTLKK